MIDDVTFFDDEDSPCECFWVLFEGWQWIAGPLAYCVGVLEEMRSLGPRT